MSVLMNIPLETKMSINCLIVVQYVAKTQGIGSVNIIKMHLITIQYKKRTIRVLLFDSNC